MTLGLYPKVCLSGILYVKPKKSKETFLFGIIDRNADPPQNPDMPRKTTAKPALDPFVHTKKTTFMQRVADLVRSGHNLYVLGDLPLAKFATLASKFAQRYPIERGKLEASRGRKRGEASARLLAYQLDGEPQLHWILLYCQGTTEDHQEKWRDALVDRIELTGYELVRQTRVGAKHPAWTWHYTRKRNDELRSAILVAIRTRHDEQLRQLIQTIWRTPGFAGARAQVKKMEKLLRDDWKRNRGSDELPEIPARLGYVRRLADVGKVWSELMAIDAGRTGKVAE